MSVDTPIQYIKIALPEYTSRARGKGITARVRNGVPIKIYALDEEHEMLVKAADLCHVPLATFVRFCAVQAAKQVMKQNEDGHVIITESDGNA